LPTESSKTIYSLMHLSICVPTYNRAQHLANCLESIRVSRSASKHEVQVCVSDNGSDDSTVDVVRRAGERMDIKYFRSPSNVGIPKNFLSVVDLADGEFVWLIGDDDLIVPDAVERVCALIAEWPTVDFFYVNAFLLDAAVVLSSSQPFSTADLPPGMDRFSSFEGFGGKGVPFFRLIDPKVSFDFLGGMYLSVFRRANWNAHVGALKSEALSDQRVFSHFDNTFPHVKIFSRAFAGSRAFFEARPLSVSLYGSREWAPMYPLILSVRFREALEEYRSNGLPLIQYLRCRNFTLRTFIPNMGFMILNKDVSGYDYVDPLQNVLKNWFYPNTYLSLVYYVWRQARALARRVLKNERS
jgi:glycosyltransferase involved in cell wall biosynthesis